MGFCAPPRRPDLPPNTQNKTDKLKFLYYSLGSRRVVTPTTDSGTSDLGESPLLTFFHTRTFLQENLFRTSFLSPPGSDPEPDLRLLLGHFLCLTRVGSRGTRTSYGTTDDGSRVVGNDGFVTVEVERRLFSLRPDLRSSLQLYYTM